MAFPYFGAKWQTARTYPAPRYSTIIEPFGGAAGYSCWHLVHGNASQAVIADTDPAVIALWSRLLASGADAISDWETPKLGSYTSDPFALWLLGGSAAAVDRIGQRGRKVTPRVVEGFPAARERAAWIIGTVGHRITVLAADYRKVTNLEATWHIDPPYQHQGHLYGQGSQAIDFTHLAWWARSRFGQVMVCEQEGADWLPFQPFRVNHDLTGRPRIEAIWLNEPASLLDLID